MVGREVSGAYLPTHHTAERSEVADAQLFRCRFAAIALSQFLPNREARHRQLLLRNLPRPQRQPRSKVVVLRLHVPADVPVREFWSVTVRTPKRRASSSTDAPHPWLARQGLDQERRRLRWTSALVRNRAPAKSRTRSIPSSDRRWFPWFRLYGPEKAVLTKSLKLPDIERVK